MFLEVGVLHSYWFDFAVQWKVFDPGCPVAGPVELVDLAAVEEKLILKPQASPFIQRDRSQCRHTVWRKLRRFPPIPPSGAAPAGAEATFEGLMEFGPATAAFWSDDWITGIRNWGFCLFGANVAEVQIGLNLWFCEEAF
nr:hypothetical protein Iba_chr06fCG5710 [Ipomoea batatas]